MEKISNYSTTDIQSTRLMKREKKESYNIYDHHFVRSTILKEFIYISSNLKRKSYYMFLIGVFNFDSI